MPIITPDTSGAANLEAIAPGTYRARITKVESGQSKSGNPKIVVHMDVEVDGKARGRQAHIVTSGPGSFNFDNLLRACRLDEAADAIKQPGSNYAFDTDVLEGQEVQVVIDSQMYNNELRDEIKKYLRA